MSGNKLETRNFNCNQTHIKFCFTPCMLVTLLHYFCTTCCWPKAIKKDPLHYLQSCLTVFRCIYKFKASMHHVTFSSTYAVQIMQFLLFPTLFDAVQRVRGIKLVVFRRFPCMHTTPQVLFRNCIYNRRWCLSKVHYLSVGCGIRVVELLRQTENLKALLAGHAEADMSFCFIPQEVGECEKVTSCSLIVAVSWIVETGPINCSVRFLPKELALRQLS